jgi:hypothetical protein
MTVIDDLTSDEQLVLRSAIEAAAIAVSAASPGRKEETVSEGFAAAEFVLSSQPAYVGNTLVTSILVALQERVRQDAPFPDFVAAALAPSALEQALTTLGEAAAVVDRQATTEEAAGYKGWLLDIARVTAEAGKEDQGFLGRGGVLVNEREREAIAKVAEILGLTPQDD